MRTGKTKKVEKMDKVEKVEKAEKERERVESQKYRGSIPRNYIKYIKYACNVCDYIRTLDAIVRKRDILQLLLCSPFTSVASLLLLVSSIHI